MIDMCVGFSKLPKKCPLEHKILLMLLQKSDVSLTEISKATGTCRQTVYCRLGRLTEYGLINVSKIKGMPPKCSVSLTEKGKEAAAFLSTLENPKVQNSGGQQGAAMSSSFMSSSQFKSLRLKIKSLMA